jgi:hypothetical protein
VSFQTGSNTDIDAGFVVALKTGQPLRQLVQQRLRVLQVRRIETFGEPVVDWIEQITRFRALALVAPESARLTDARSWNSFALCRSATEMA